MKRTKKKKRKKRSSICKKSLKKWNWKDRWDEKEERQLIHALLHLTLLLTSKKYIIIIFIIICNYLVTNLFFYLVFTYQVNRTTGDIWYYFYCTMVGTYWQYYFDRLKKKRERKRYILLARINKLDLFLVLQCSPMLSVSPIIYYFFILSLALSLSLLSFTTQSYGTQTIFWKYCRKSSWANGLS